MFAEDYRELKLPDAESVARRCFLFEDFIENFLSWEPDALIFNDQAGAHDYSCALPCQVACQSRLMRQLASGCRNGR